MLTEAELAAIRERDAEDMPAVRSERLQPTNVWADRHRLLADHDALTAALAAERALADGLADYLVQVLDGDTEMVAVLSRYRAARQEGE